MHYMKSMSSKSQGTFGLPEAWSFDYPWSVVKIGFWLWMVSGFERLPNQQEVMAYDPRWITDMQLAYQMHDFYKNRSPLFDILHQHETGETEGDFTPKAKEKPSHKNYEASQDLDAWEALLKQIEGG